MRQRACILIYGVALDVLLDIDVQRLADRLGAKAAVSKGCKSRLAGGDIKATVSKADRERVLTAIAQRR